MSGVHGIAAARTGSGFYVRECGPGEAISAWKRARAQDEFPSTQKRFGLQEAGLRVTVTRSPKPGSGQRSVAILQDPRREEGDCPPDHRRVRRGTASDSGVHSADVALEEAGSTTSQTGGNREIGAQSCYRPAQDGRVGGRYGVIR